MFEQMYRCYPMSYINREELEKGDKIIMPCSALDRLSYLEIDYPMLFQLRNPSSGKLTHCGVLEFTAEEGLIYLPSWMMETMLVEESDILIVKNACLSKGTFVKLQPHTKDFLDISNPRAILEKTLRNYSCLTTGGTVAIYYNSKKFYIDILETKPSRAICIIETDCEVDFAPPLDYVEPQKQPAAENSTSNAPPQGDEEHQSKAKKYTPFSGSARRLDGKASTQVEPVPVPATAIKNDESAAKPGSLVFGSRKRKPENETIQEPTLKEEEKKFQPFTGRKCLLRG